MAPLWQLTLVFALSLLQDATGARILALLTTPSPSHHIWNRVLVRALAERGHHVTTLSPDVEKDRHPNHHEVIIEDGYAHLRSDEQKFDFHAMSENGPLTNLDLMQTFGLMTCRHAIASEGVRTLTQMRNQTFDLVIVEIVFNECLLGLVPYLGSPPVMAVTAFSSPQWAGTMLGNPDPPAYVPNMLHPFPVRMTLYQRVVNVLLYLATHLKRTYSYLPLMDEMLKARFGETMPSVRDIEQNMSMILVNTDVSFDYLKPLVPAMVPVGGLHIRPIKPLPKDLQKFMDEAPHGVIFFSLGSNLRSDSLGQDKIDAIISAFRELPQRVLWKWESDTLPGQPDNVRVGKWMPQSDILGHPNLRLFITHCGLLSLQEAVYHAVPVLGIPFFADQHINMQKAVSHGIGEKIAYNTLTSQRLVDAIRKVTENSSYRENMKRLSQIFRDHPETPLERAVFWIEYVIRHKGATHLRSAAADMAWYQVYLLDVVGVLAAGSLLAVTAVWMALRALVAFVVGGKVEKHKKQ